MSEAFCGSPCVLVGSSFGGQLAIDFALTYPALVAGLVLIGPGLSGHRRSAARRARMSALAAAARRGSSALAELWLKDPHLCPNGFPMEVEQQVRDMLHDNINLFVSPPASIEHNTTIGDLGRLAVRGEVYVGERDDSDNREIAATLAAAASGDLALHVVPDAGHFPMLERTGWLPQVLRASFARSRHCG